MNNYVYIIAGLPDIVLDFKNNGLSYHDLSTQIKEFVLEKDLHIIELCEKGFDDKELGESFYRQINSCNDKFLSTYYTFDKNLRNTQVLYLAKKNNLKSDGLTVGDVDNEFEEYKQVESILANPNILEREKLLDNLRWEKVSQITIFEYFTLDKILAFLVKMNIVERWNKSDAKTGQEFFQKLVEEVRGTFKVVQFE